MADRQLISTVLLQPTSKEYIYEVYSIENNVEIYEKRKEGNNEIIINFSELEFIADTEIGTSGVSCSKGLLLNNTITEDSIAKLNDWIDPYHYECDRSITMVDVNDTPDDPESFVEMIKLRYYFNYPQYVPYYYMIQLYDYAMHTVIVDAKVTLVGQNDIYTEYTNIYGSAGFRNIPAGIYKAKIEKQGYYTLEIEIDVNAGIDYTMYQLVKPGVETLTTFSIWDALTYGQVNGATVSFNGTVKETDSSGALYYENIIPGMYTIEITCDGYVPYSSLQFIYPGEYYVFKVTHID